jgi:hypothetical protein
MEIIGRSRCGQKHEEAKEEPLLKEVIAPGHQPVKKAVGAEDDQEEGEIMQAMMRAMAADKADE